MKMRCLMKLSLPLVLFSVCTGAAFPTMNAHGDGELSVPRIMLLGDSWSGFMYAFRTYKNILETNPDTAGYAEIGTKSAVMGARAFEFLPDSYNYLAGILEDLELHPTVDMVVITLGGNDFMRGTYNIIPGDPTREVEWKDCYLDPELDEQLLFDGITRDMGAIIDAVLNVHPDIRVAIVGYTFGGRAEDFATIEEQQMGFVRFEQAKKALAESKDRVYYVHNFGLLQWHYGTIDQPPPIGPYPGGYPDYDPMPGGDPSQLVNHAALFDADIHLTEDGYALLGQRVYDEFLADWLAYPKVLGITLQAGKAPLYTFAVTFSEAVTGVDVSDFQVVDAGPGAKEPTLVSVENTGDGIVYLVTVDMGESKQPPVLSLVDDDSILDGDLKPLGGPAIPGDPGDGSFAANGVYPFEDMAAPEPTDFEGCLRWLHSAAYPYYVLLDEEGVTGATFDPEGCDINGSFQIEPDIAIDGNSMLDALEYALIGTCYNDPTLDLRPDGIWHDRVVSAFDQNYAQMLLDMGGADGTIATVFPAIPPILAALMTIGDSSSKLIPILAGVAGATQVPENWPIVINYVIETNYDLLPEYFGPDERLENYC